jgi:nucleoside triphosphate diphosphatase
MSYTEKIAQLEKIKPATAQATQIGAFSQIESFDWERLEDVFSKFLSEVSELKESWISKPKEVKSTNAVEDEIGDVFFTLTQLCRHIGIDAEKVFLESNKKFCKRFKKMRNLLASEGRSWSCLNLQEKEILWQRAKVLLNKGL